MLIFSGPHPEAPVSLSGATSMRTSMLAGAPEQPQEHPAQLLGSMYRSRTGSPSPAGSAVRPVTFSRGDVSIGLGTPYSG